MAWRIESLESRTLLAFGAIDQSWANGGWREFAFDGTINSTGGVLDVFPTRTRVYVALPNGMARLDRKGRLDQSFGANGQLEIPDTELAFRSAISPDGSIYLATRGRASDSVRLRKFDSRGQAVSSFGTAGAALITASPGFFPRAIYVSNDEVIIGGSQTNTLNGTKDIAIRRYSSDGALDSTFAAAGMLNISFAPAGANQMVNNELGGIYPTVGGGYLFTGEALVLKIGESSGPARAYAGVMKRTRNGAADSSFGTGGAARQDVTFRATLEASRFGVRGDGDSSAIHAASAIDAAGRIVVFARGGRLAATRFSASGQILSTGYAPDEFAVDTPVATAALPDGRVAVIGTSPFGAVAQTNEGAPIAVLNVDGTIGPAVLTNDLDPATPDLRATVYATSGAMAVDPATGKLFVAGEGPDLTPTVTRVAPGQAGDPRPDDFAGAVFNKLAFDAQGALHLAFAKRDGGVYYVYRAPNLLWSSPALVHQSGTLVSDLAIAVDVSGRPTIVFRNASTHTLMATRYLNRHVGWKTTTIDATGDTGYAPSAAFSFAGELGVSYQRRDGRDFRFARFGGDGVWHATTLDAKGDAGRETVALGYPDSTTGCTFAVGYTEDRTGTLKLAVEKAGRWIFSVVGQSDRPLRSLSASNPGLDVTLAATDEVFGSVLTFSTQPGSPGFNAGALTGPGVFNHVINRPRYSGGPAVYSYDPATLSMRLSDYGETIDLLGRGKLDNIEVASTFVSQMYRIETAIAYRTKRDDVLHVRPTFSSRYVDYEPIEYD